MPAPDPSRLADRSPLDYLAGSRVSLASVASVESGILDGFPLPDSIQDPTPAPTDSPHCRCRRDTPAAEQPQPSACSGPCSPQTPPAPPLSSRTTERRYKRYGHHYTLSAGSARDTASPAAGSAAPPPGGADLAPARPAARDHDRCRAGTRPPPLVIDRSFVESADRPASSRARQRRPPGEGAAPDRPPAPAVATTTLHSAPSSATASPFVPRSPAMSPHGWPLSGAGLAPGPGLMLHEGKAPGSELSPRSGQIPGATLPGSVFPVFPARRPYRHAASRSAHYGPVLGSDTSPTGDRQFPIRNRGAPLTSPAASNEAAIVGGTAPDPRPSPRSELGFPDRGQPSGGKSPLYSPPDSANSPSRRSSGTLDGMPYLSISDSGEPLPQPPRRDARSSGRDPAAAYSSLDAYGLDPGVAPGSSYSRHDSPGSAAGFPSGAPPSEESPFDSGRGAAHSRANTDFSPYSRSPNNFFRNPPDSRHLTAHHSGEDPLPQPRRARAHSVSRSWDAGDNYQFATPVLPPLSLPLLASIDEHVREGSRAFAFCADRLLAHRHWALVAASPHNHPTALLLLVIGYSEKWFPPGLTSFPPLTNVPDSQLIPTALALVRNRLPKATVLKDLADPIFSTVAAGVADFAIKLLARQLDLEALEFLELAGGLGSAESYASAAKIYLKGSRRVHKDVSKAKRLYDRANKIA